MAYWYHFCQGGACWERSDDFNRADSDNPGGAWDERPGANWRIVANELVCDGGPQEGKLIFTSHNGQVSFYITIDLKEPDYHAYAESYYQEAGSPIAMTEWVGLFTTRHPSQRLLAFLVTAVEAPIGSLGFSVDLQTCAGVSLLAWPVDFDSNRAGCEVAEGEVSTGTLGEDVTVGVVVSGLTDSSSSSSSSEGDSPGQGLLATVYWRDTTERRYGVIVNYVDDNNYFLCQYTPSPLAGGLGRLELFRVAGGVKTSLVHSDLAPEWADQLHVCFTPKAFYADFNALPPINLWVVDPEYYPTGYKAGLHVDSTEGAVAFDNWYFSEHWYTNTECPRCECWCIDNALPMTLTLTISAESVPGTGTGGGDHPMVDCLDGTEIQLTYDLPTSFKWVGEAGPFTDCPDCPWNCFSDFEIAFEFICGINGLGTFTLEVDGTIGEIACEYLSSTLTNPTGACDPLALEFVTQLDGCYVNETTDTDDLRLTYMITE